MMMFLLLQTAAPNPWSFAVAVAGLGIIANIATTLIINWTFIGRKLQIFDDMRRTIRRQEKELRVIRERWFKIAGEPFPEIAED